MVTMSYRCFVRSCFLTAWFVQQLPAATWDGGLSHANFTVNDFWSTPNNWADAVPTPGITTDVIFALSGLRTTANQNIANPLVVRSVTFAAAANVTALAGNQLSVVGGGSMTQNSAVNVAVNLPLSLVGAVTLTGSGSGTLALNNPIGGAGPLKLLGTAGGPGLKVSLNAANTFSGITQIGDATAGSAPAEVTFGNDSAAGIGALTFFNGNTLRASSGTRNLVLPISLIAGGNGLPLTFTFGAGDNLNLHGAINLNTGAKTLQIDNAATTFFGSIAGSAAVSKNGSGTLTLAAANPLFTGSWTIQSGVLNITDPLALAPASVTINVNDGLNITSNSSAGLGALSGSGNLNLGSTALSVGTNNLDSTYAGRLAAASATSGSLKKVGTGNFTLSGSGSAFNSLSAESGTTTLNGSSITLGGLFAVGGTAAVGTCLMTNGATLNVNSSSTMVVTGGTNTSLTMDGPGTFAASAFQCVIAGGNGPGANWGQLNLRNQAALQCTFLIAGAGGLNGSGNLTVASGASALCAAGIVGFDSAGTALVTGPTSQWGNNSSFGLGGFSAAQSGGTGTLIVSNGASVYVNGPTTFWTAGNFLNVDGGKFRTDTLAVQNGPGDGSIALSDPDEATSALTIGIANGNCTFPGPINNSSTGPGSLSKVGTGTVILSGPLGYTGFTRVQGGTLAVTRSFPFAGSTQVSGNAVLQMNGVWGNVLSQTAISPGGTLAGNGILRGSVTNSGLIEISGTNSLAFTGSVVNNGVMRFKAGGSFTASGPFVNNGVLDLISAGSTNLPPGLINQGTILDRSSLRFTVAKDADQVVIALQTAYAGHTYRLQQTTNLAAAFSDTSLTFTATANVLSNFVLGGVKSPQTFYRFKVD